MKKSSKLVLNSEKNIHSNKNIFVCKVIDRMASKKQKINFMSVAKTSGVSRSYLYKHENIKEKILQYRQAQMENAPILNYIDNRNKDVIIAALESKVCKLEVVIKNRDAKIVALNKDIERLNLIICEG